MHTTAHGVPRTCPCCHEPLQGRIELYCGCGQRYHAADFDLEVPPQRRSPEGVGRR